MVTTALEQRRAVEQRWEAEAAAEKQRWWKFLESFPSLAQWSSVAQAAKRPWDAERFDKWAAGPCPGHGALEAARFVLSVWNPGTQWKCGRFNLHEALWCWDHAHKEAFLRWCAEPFWP